jgi:hypothetical protein
MYPVIAEPPLLVGAAQDRLIWDDEDVVAVRLVGGCGAVAALCVVTDALFDGEPVPTEFIADTV